MTDATSELAPEDAVRHYSLGVVRHGSGDHRGAIAAYKKAIALEPDYWEPYDSAAACLGELGRWHDAARFLEEALRRHPEGGTADTHQNLAIALRMSGRHEDAVGAARRAIERHPDSVAAYGTLAGVCADRGRWGEALQHLRRLFQIRGASRSPSEYFNLGFALAETGDLGGATGALEQAVSRNPDELDPLLRLGAAYLAAGLEEDAVDVLEQAVKKHPSAAEAHGLHAAALQSLGRDEEALAAFERARQEDRDYFQRYPEMAELLATARSSSSAP